MEPLTPQIITTKDGSHSLLNPQLNETYHSVHGALQESQYVFIDRGLKHWFHPARDRAAVLEVGFGTGLNALLALEFAATFDKAIDYTAVEAFPLVTEIWQQLNYAESLGLQSEFRSLHEQPWQELKPISNHFSLLKLHTTLELVVLESLKYDVVFYDAFAPSKQPEMWTLYIISKVVAAMSAGGVFVTYCAKGQLKRDLKTLGLEVETLQGPPGKKEMIRAIKRN
jgi:tRNA U34 5-methylaminomethyl-2-thiouridine-forming methyltransferase MnmC